ncbi:exporter of polyketide antibiotics [Actinorhabdospora filicis]|uniref:Exporter of polyketide antibiotics n=1 Tax=Actinorhabdospora filicis TaxID=1785913 RepID=A0A9W6SHE4_9ACTN|nr:ABC transporter permease [Actinorhabdospora filicis]GLZ75489.1 exporter of polyketide antibiotics [Actinorhabdospora filicis]
MNFAGTWSLVRLALRRDRILLPVWLIAFALILQSAVATFTKLYDTAQERAELAASVASNPTFEALYGPLYGDSTGAFLSWRYGTTIGVFAALMSLLIAVRHTRAEEETGRLELVRAGVVGRLAPLTSSLITVYLANLVLFALTAAITAGGGLDGAGSIAFAFQITVNGVVFGTLAGLTAQITESARFASGLAGLALGGCYLLRAVGDTGGPAWLSWLSPIGWALRLRPFEENAWWVLGLFAALTAVLLTGAYSLQRRRDFGAGLVAPRPGPATARPSLRTPLALAWRLQRGLLLGWVIGFVLLGAVFGGAANGVEDIFDSNPQLMEVLERLDQGSIIDIYMTMIMGITALIVSVYSIQATLRLRAEETGLLAEPVLATGVGRVKWAAGHLAFAVIGPAVLLLTAGAAMGLVYGAAVGDVGGQLTSSLRSSAVQLPAVWVLTGLAVALFGLAPRLAALAWAALVVFVLLGQLGPILQLDQWAMDLSPFTHVPAPSASTFDAAPLLWLLALAAALTTAGLTGLRRRDIASAG